MTDFDSYSGPKSGFGFGDDNQTHRRFRPPF